MQKMQGLERNKGLNVASLVWYDFFAAGFHIFFFLQFPKQIRQNLFFFDTQ